MPIYEFYCPTCHVVFSFFSKTMDTTKRPDCPDCGASDLERQVSRFAISKVQPDRDFPGMRAGNHSLADAMSKLQAAHDKMDHDDPKHAIPMIKGVYEIAGMPMPDKAREAIRLLEAGADMETVGAEVGDLWGSEDSPFAEGQPLHGHLPGRAPRVDESLYEL